jgi:hypothetical protein
MFADKVETVNVGDDERRGDFMSERSGIRSELRLGHVAAIGLVRDVGCLGSWFETWAILVQEGG